MRTRPTSLVVQVVLLVPLLFAACASAPEAAPPEVAPELSEPPYTAAQIRAASATGRTYVWRVTSKDAAVTLHTTRFEAVEDTGCTLNMEDRDEAGAVTWGPQSAQASWTDLESHGRFPRAALTVTRAAVTVPAGTFESRLYEVVMPPEEGGAGPLLVRFWFADALPGAPVKIETLQGGQVVELRELVEHRPGSN